MSAAAPSRAAIGIAAVLWMFAVIPGFAQSTTENNTAQPNGHPIADSVKFLAGAALGLGMHEGGHLIFDAVFDAHPRVKPVHFGPFPFFAVTHRPDLSPRREFSVSSAGFWVQETTNEWLFTRKRPLRTSDAWITKGVFAFNVLNSVGYALVAFAKAGPAERDTRGMADSIDVDERVVGAVVLAPAALDAYRYFRPGSGWAVWTSRATKVGSVLLVLKRRSSSRR